MTEEAFPKGSFPAENPDRWRDDEYMIGLRKAEYIRLHGEEEGARLASELERRFKEHAEKIDAARVALDNAQRDFDAAWAEMRKFQEEIGA